MKEPIINKISLTNWVNKLKKYQQKTEKIIK